MLNQFVSIIEKIESSDDEAGGKDVTGDVERGERQPIGEGSAPGATPQSAPASLGEDVRGEALSLVEADAEQHEVAASMTAEAAPPLCEVGAAPGPRAVGVAGVVLEVLEGSAAAERHRKTLRELQDAVEGYAAFKADAVGWVEECIQAVQACAEGRDGDGRSRLDAVLQALTTARLPAATQGAQDVRAWYAAVRDEVAKEATGETALEHVVSQLQAALIVAEREAAGLRAQLREAAAGGSSKADRDHVVVEVPSPSPEGCPSPGAVEALRQKLAKAHGDLSEKQAAMSVLYAEKEDLQNRLQNTVAKLALAHVAPKANLDESRFYKSLGNRGRIGLRMQSVAAKVDLAALEVGRVLYGNAPVRVAIAFYLIFMHVWVFYVVSSTVHMLPHLPENAHQHHMFHSEHDASASADKF